jgi:polyvinyl alcohol dehydrogenase (cytochrome)
VGRIALIGAAAWVCAAALAAQPPDGAAIFARDCAGCHDGVEGSRAPKPDILRQRSPEAILSALTAGGMRPQGGRLSGAERRAVAEYLSGRPIGGDITGASQGRCSVPAPVNPASSSWPGWAPSLTNTRFQPQSMVAEDVPRLSLKWAFGFPDATSAWSQPTVAGGRLFVGSQNGPVYALDAQSGCIYWTFTAKSGVRTALTFDGDPAAGGTTVFFGDTGANVYALNAETGRERWSRTVDAHPLARITGSLTVVGGRVFVPVSSIEETAANQPGYGCCTFRGSLNALDAATGAVRWRTFTVPEPQALGKNAAGVTLLGPAGVGIWSAPTFDLKRNIVYAATGNTYSGPAQPTADAVVAFDPASGAIKWIKQFTAGDVFGCRAGAANCGEKAGPDFDFGTPPMLVARADGRDLLVLAQKSGMAYAIDPDKEGEILWQYRAGEGSIWGGLQWGAAVDAERGYFPVSDIRLPKPGGLHAVQLSTGERAWYVAPLPLKCAAGPGCSAAMISAPTLIRGVLFAGSNDGALRAFSTKDGSIVWEFDTNRQFETLNGVRAGGGAIQGPGPTIVGRMLYLNSGYGDHLGRPGNVLLAFSVE